MAIYVIDSASRPQVIVAVTDDEKEAADIARKYADHQRSEVHVVTGDAIIVAPAPIVRVPITDVAMANAMNVLVETDVGK